MSTSRIDYRHPRRGTVPRQAAPADAAGAGAGARPGGLDHTRAPRVRPVPDPAPAPRAPRTGIDYNHPRRARVRGTTPAATGADAGSAAVSGPGFLLHTNADGSIVRFDPERPIAVSVNVDQAGRWALDDVEEALWRVSCASGLTFEFAGTTERIPQAGDYDGHPARPTLTIAWAKPGTVRGGSDLLDPDELASSVPRDLPPGAEPLAVGIGGWRTMGVRYGDGPWRTAITTAIVVLDSTVRELFPPGFGTGACRGAVLMHEIAHAVGLGHVDDPAQMMFPVVTAKPAQFAAGDLEGLRRIGTAAGPLL
ncbi:matrixin [Kineococcus xinjiangensis]|uniref:Matrixin n=1 Tax=Kineococcus xinjiangensis TaxID=512762 RepID=A0A2S6IKQ6_9ACTN|nr:matrixin family metalloprotease [Kineococcus xinjiangensis]PPK94730.1 matrixin [Kineococcus xinjiangensis]